MNTPLPFEISPVQTKQAIDQDASCLLLDVREQAEHDVANIVGSLFIPMSEIQTRIAELRPHKDQRIIVHCHHGGRSQQVACWLIDQGFRQVQNLSGGIEQWSLQIDPSVPRY